MAIQVAEKQLTTETPSKKPDKRQAIIEAARVLFTTEGYEATTIADVARKAGVAVGTVYLYFKNKTGLLAGVKGDWDREFLQFMAQPELQTIPHHHRARPLIEACFAMVSQHIESIQLMGLPPQILGELYDKESADCGVIEQTLEAFFDEGIAAGSFRPIDSHAAAPAAYGMVDRAIVQCFTVEGGKDQQRYVDTLVDALERWLVRPELLDT